MTDTSVFEVSGYLSKAWNRAIWSGLSRDQRVETRREYRHLRRSLQLAPRAAAGIINRMLALATWEH